MFTKNNGQLMFTEKTYDIGNKLVRVFLPALSALYFGLASIWGLPNAEQVVGTIAVFTTFLGMCLGVSSKHYEESGAAYDGDILVSEGEDGVKRFTLDLGEQDLNKLDEKKKVSFKIVPPAT